jgi:nucleotide-binding universal stress UspA family protein
MSIFPTKILLATDGSKDANLAARAAIDLSKKGGSELHVVHVWHDVPTPHLHSFVRAQLKQEAQEVLDKQVEQIEHAGGTVAGAHLREGRTIDEILDLSEELEIGLLIVGSRGLGGAKRILLGSISEGIVHHSRRPVLVMRGGQNAWPPVRIVIADDSSDDAKKAGELAAEIGRLFESKALLMRVYPMHLEKARSVGDSESQKVKEAFRQAETDLRERADRLEDILGRRPATAIKVSDDPAAAILEVTQEKEEPTLIAVGSRGLGPIQRMRLGSVSTKVVRAAPGPVLVCPHPRSEPKS